MDLKRKIKNKEYKITEKDEFIYHLKQANSHNIIEKSQEIKNIIDKLIKFEGLVQSSERPDIIFYDGINIIGIEQMNFSSYYHTKNGDSQLKKYNEGFNENFKRFIEKRKNTFKSKIAVLKCSNEYYENSFIKIFDKHYKKIENYIDNLKIFNKPIKIYFLISNKTLEYTKAMFKGKMIKYNPTYNKKILEYIKEKDKVNGLIFEEPFYGKKDFYYLKNNKINIENLLKKNQDYFDCKIMNNKIKIITFSGGIQLC